MCRLKTFFCNFDLVVKLAPLAGKSMFACYHDAEFVNSEAKSIYSPFLIFCFIFWVTFTVILDAIPTIWCGVCI